MRALRFAALMVVPVLAIGVSVTAVTPVPAGEEGRGGTRRMHGKAVQRKAPGEGSQAASRRTVGSSTRSIATIRAAISEYVRLHPDRGGVLSARLRTVRDLAESAGIDVARTAAERLGVPLIDDQVLVRFRFARNFSSTAAQRLEGLGLALNSGADGLSSAMVALGDLEMAASVEGVLRMEAPRAMRLHDVTSEGVSSTSASIWQAYDPPQGLPLDRPVRVAVIDGGFSGYQSLLGDDLPASVETAYFCADVTGDEVPDGSMDGCDSYGPLPHGVAVAEVVHDMAPEAELYLMNIDLAVDSLTHWQAAISTAVTWNADIITTSMGTVQADRNGNGTLCSRATSLRQEGILWTTSAGNGGDPCGHEHYGWSPSGVFGDHPYGEYQGFPGGSSPILNEFTLPAGHLHILDLNWNSWNTVPTDDFALFYLCDLGEGLEVIESSDYEQCGAEESLPWEVLGIVNEGVTDIQCAYAVLEYVGGECTPPSDELFDVWSDLSHDTTGVPACPNLTGGPYLEESTSAFSIGHPADCEDILGVGAVFFYNNDVEVFSGRGPTLDGRVKPDICAPDFISGATYGEMGFGGTSASAPHVAGALALLYQKIGGSFTLERCREILYRRAPNTGSPNTTCGVGPLCMSSTGCD